MTDPIETWSLSEGLMNRNWRVRTREGVWAVKQLLDVDAEAARRQHRITRTLADLGLPVPPPQATPDGNTVIELPGIGMFAVLPWVEGVHRDGRDLTVRECRHLGEVLARIHQGLGCDRITDVLAPAPESQLVTVTEAAKAKAKIDHYLELLAGRTELDEFDRLVRQHLRQRQALLERLVYLRPDDTRPVAPIGWVHGDFHDLNLLWSAGPSSRVTAVLDWDRLRIGPVATEVVRTATLVFGYDLNPELRALDLERVAAFTAGYRGLIPLPEASLAEAVHRLWWERVCDFWQLTWHYEKANTSCDHLFVSASALLAWWSEHHDGVCSAFITA
ncbi:MAG: phosphotransferase [Actinomycetota bacterium]|nr:phosphotransferase [Actinomycetota bacterium]